MDAKYLKCLTYKEKKENIAKNKWTQNLNFTNLQKWMEAKLMGWIIYFMDFVFSFFVNGRCIEENWRPYTSKGVNNRNFRGLIWEQNKPDVFRFFRLYYQRMIKFYDSKKSAFNPLSDTFRWDRHTKKVGFFRWN